MEIKKHLITVKEAAYRMSFAESTIYALIARGELEASNHNPGRKGLRVVVASIESYIANNRQ